MRLRLMGAAACAAFALAGCGAPESAQTEAPAADAANAAGGEAACDRACLDGVARAYLASVSAHDPSSLKLADDVRVTEDGVEIAPGEGYWSRAGGLRQHRLNLLDPVWGVAAGLAVMQEGEDGMALLAYRLRIEDGEISEIETLVVEPEPPADGAEPSPYAANRETLSVPRDAFLVEIPAGQRESREELLRIAQYYPDGLKGGSFVDIDAPFAEDAERMENGLILAGPRCTFNETCTNMKTQRQPAGGRPTLRQRVLAVDEEQGVVFMWLDWAQASGRTLEVYEAFKIHGGQIRAVEAFLKNDDPANYPGWPLTLTPE